MPLDPKTADLMLTNFSAWENTLDDNQRQQLETTFKYEPDRVAAQKRFASVAFVAANTGQNVEEVSRRFEDYYMHAYARDEKGLGIVSGVKDANEFHGLLIKRANDNIVKAEKVNQARLTGRESGLSGASMPSELLRFQTAYPDATENEKLAFADTLFQASVKALPYRKLIKEASSKLSKEMESNIPSTGTFQEVASQLLSVPENDRPMVISMIGANGGATAQERSVYLSKLAGAMGRMTETVAASSLNMASDAALYGLLSPLEGQEQDTVMPTSSDDEFRILTQQIRQMADAEIAPIKGDGWWSQTGIDVARMAPQIAVTLANPAIGMTANTAYFRDTVAAQAKSEDPSLSYKQAAAIGDISAPFNAAIETVTALIPFGKIKMPFFQKWLSTATTTIAGTARKFVVRGAFGVASEVGEEMAQAVIPLWTQDALAALNKDNSGVDWEKRMPDFSQIAQQTWGPALVFGIVGGGVVSIKDIKNGRALASDVDMMVATGINPKTAVKIKAASNVQDYNTADTLFREEFVSDAKASKPDIEAATERLKARFKAQENVESLTKSTLPEYTASVTRTPTGWQVTTGDGTVIPVESAEAAQRIAVDLRQVGSQEEADTLVAVIDSYYEQGKQAETVFTGEDVQASKEIGVVGIRRDAGNAVISQRQFGPKALETVREEAEVAGIKSNTRGVFAHINGSNEVFPMRVADGAKEIVRRMNLYKSQAEGQPQVITFLHENFESTWRLGMENGTFSEQETRTAMRALLPAFEGVTALNPEEAQFINNLRTLASGKGNETMLRETVSEMVIRDVLGRDRQGRATGMKPGSISRAIEASVMGANTQEEASALKSILAAIKAFTAYLKGVFGTVDAMIKANEEGKIGAEYDTFINKVLGIDEVKQMESQTVDEVKAMLGIDEEVQAVIDAGNMAFSTSRAQPADTSNITEMPDGAQLVGPTTFSIEAYHGTPHEVDRFLTSKIGTGEGAQAFGWGLYFAKARKVAEQYRKDLSGFEELTIYTKDGKKKGSALDDVDLDAAKYLESGARAAGQFKHNTIYYAKQQAEAAGKPDVVARIESYGRDAKVGYEVNRGNLYTVELLPDEEDFLDWDKPLSEQSEKVKGILSKLLPSYEMAQEIDAEDNRLADIYNADPSMDNEFAFTNHHQSREQRLAKLVLRERNPNLYGKFANGVDIYGAFGGSLGGLNSKSTSEYFASLGIPGIRYLDGGSRAAGEGTSNYVIFDENLVKIIEKNGQKVEEMEDEEVEDMDYVPDSMSFSLSAAGFDQVYLKNQDKFKKAVKEGRAKEKVKLSNFNGKTLLLHQPDTAFSGTLSFDGETVIEGKGGAYYPILFGDKGDIWASTKKAAEWMARTLNAVGAANNGKILLGLTSASVDKLFSSTTMSSGVIRFLTKLTEKPAEFGITPNDLNEMIVQASKVEKVKKESKPKESDADKPTKFTKPKAEAKPKKFNISLSVDDGLEANTAAMQKALLPEESVFDVRRLFVESLASQIADRLSKNKAASSRMAQLLAGEDNKYAKSTILKGKLSKSAIMQGLGDLLSEPFLKTFQQFKKGGQLYAIIEMDGEVKAVESDNHDSYPYAIRSTSGKQPVANVLEKAFPWQQATTLGATGKAVPAELLSKVFPTSAGVSMNKKYGHLKVKAPSAKTSGVELTFSISPAQDAEYLAAVEAGDMTKAQAMVDAAKEIYEKTIARKPIPLRTVPERLSGKIKPEDIPALQKIALKIKERAKLRANINSGSSGYSWSAIGKRTDTINTALGNLFSKVRDESGTRDIDVAEQWLEDSWRSQIKSADLVTYDADGNVIPLSQRFNQASPDIRFSQGGQADTAQDAEYLAAAKAGDTETAQRLVDEAAKAVGATNRLQHWTNSDTFTRFDPAKINAGQGFTGTQVNGFWFNDANGTRSPFGSRKIDAFLILKNPKVFESAEAFDAATETFDSSEEFTSNLVSQGHDGVIIKPAEEWMGSQEWEFTNYVAFSPNQIKSADPITYDDAGNVIPLSQRFNEATPDIRFSISPVRNLNELSDQVERQFAENPVGALEVKARVIRQFAKLADKWSNERWTPQGNKIRPISEKRTVKSLDKEQAMRQARALDEILANQGFTSADAMRSKDAKDYEAWQRFQESKDLLLSGGMTEEEAQKLAGASASTWRKNFVNAIREATKKAKAEAQAWRDETDAMQKEDWSPKESLVRDLITLEAIVAIFPVEIRGKIGGFVALARKASESARLKVLQKQLERGQVLLEKHLKEQYGEAVDKLFDKYRPERKAGEKPKGKLDPDAQEISDKAEMAMKLSADQANAEIAAINVLLDADNISAEEEAKLEAMRELVQLLGDWKNASSARRESAFIALNDVLTEGWAKWKLKQLLKREQREEMRKMLKSATGKKGVASERDKMKKDAAKVLGKADRWVLNLSSFSEVMRAVFGENASRQFVDDERNASNQYEDAIQEFSERIDEFFTTLSGGVLRGERLRFDLAQPTLTVGAGGMNERNISQLQSIQALLMWQQEDGRRHMEGPRDENGAPIEGKWSYDQAWIDELTSKLSPEALEVKKFLEQLYSEEWVPLNAVYRERHGVNLPRHDKYAPITVTPQQAKAGEMVDPVSGAAVAGSILTPGSLRSRNRSALAEPEFRDALSTFIAHTKQMEHWKAYYDLAVEMQSVLGNRDVSNSVKAAVGDEGVTVLRKWIDVFAQGGTRDAAAGLAISSGLSKLAGRVATVGLLGRFSTLLVQSTQLAAASVKMPLGSYLKRFSMLMSGNLQWSDAINSEFIQRRIKSAPPLVSQAMQGLGEATRPNEIKRVTLYLGQLLSGADGLFTAGTYAILLDYHRTMGVKMGMQGEALESYAHAEAVNATEQVAQPVRTGTRSIIEVTNTNPLAKMSWAYASEARQKMALFAWSAYNAKNDPAGTAKTAFLVFVVGGLMSQVLKNLWREAKGDDDEKKWSPERLAMSLLSPITSAIPGAAMIAGEGGSLSGAQYTKQSIKDVFDGKADMKDVDTILSAMGYFNDTAGGIATLSHAGYDFAQLLDNAFGED